MKRLKKFIRDKGGLKLFLISIALILIACFFIILGCVYAYYDGNWGKIPEMLSSDFAISVYIILGIVIFALFYITIIFGRNKEIK